jgi:hypothetical protein
LIHSPSGTAFFAAPGLRLIFGGSSFWSQLTTPSDHLERRKCPFSALVMDAR